MEYFYPSLIFVLILLSYALLRYHRDVQRFFMRFTPRHRENEALLRRFRASIQTYDAPEAFTTPHPFSLPARREGFSPPRRHQSANLPQKTRREPSSPPQRKTPNPPQKARHKPSSPPQQARREGFSPPKQKLADAHPPNHPQPPPLQIPKQEPPSPPPSPPRQAPYQAPKLAQAPLLPVSVLSAQKRKAIDPSTLEGQGALIEQTLASFGVSATVVHINHGPRITQFGVKPGFVERKERGKLVKRRVRVSTITRLKHDLALALSAKSLRIETPVPGKPYIGIELPNPEPEVVTLRSVLESQPFKKIYQSGGLAVALGRNVAGEAVAMDLTQLPHLLIAGATGSGKSVCINVCLASLLFKYQPSQVNLLLIDPKMVELIPYNGIPHLIRPVVIDVAEAAGALTWVVGEMERRLKVFSEAQKRHLTSYNEWASQNGQQTLPYIVVVIDELADLMMIAADEVEPLLARLAQLARATGIHLILATQRPSVKVITGLIKANIPARIAFAVASQIDSRVILDTNGSEALLGRGDMLMSDGGKTCRRIQGCFVSDAELQKIIDYWQRLAGSNQKNSPVLPQQKESAPQQKKSAPSQAPQAVEDKLLQKAIEIVREYEYASTSFLRRKLRISYQKAALLIEALEERGIIGRKE